MFQLKIEMIMDADPDEVGVQKVAHIVSGRITPLPNQEMLLVKGAKNRARVPLSAGL